MFEQNIDWFTPILNFINRLFPIIQNTAVDVLEWVVTDIPRLSEAFGFSVNPMTLIFASGLTLILTGAIIEFVLRIIGFIS